jgi:hypothetical protein
MGRAARTDTLSEGPIMNYDDNYDMAAPHKDCFRCQTMADGRSATTEFIQREIHGMLYQFDVSRAFDYSKDRPIVELEGPLLDLFLTISGVGKEHVDHVDERHPGFILQIQDGVFLVDGHHRAHKCRKLGIPFQAYVFGEEHSNRLLKRVESKPCNTYESDVTKTGKATIIKS